MKYADLLEAKTTSLRYLEFSDLEPDVSIKAAKNHIALERAIEPMIILQNQSQTRVQEKRNALFAEGKTENEVNELVAGLINLENLKLVAASDETVDFKVDAPLTRQEFYSTAQKIPASWTMIMLRVGLISEV